ncbi:MAG: glycoside hydrolase family 3 C-terminal domain-containing protein, partial [Deinococcales bacterium]|nr:glycoside hydrolase family 3 C-terminal domain-containing protein [Chitinophagaceae bacterium]
LQGEVVYEKGINLIDNNVFKPIYQSNAFSYNNQVGFQAEYFKNTKWDGKPAAVKTINKIDFQWGDGEQVADGVFANEMSIRFTANYTAEKTGEITFELKGDDRCSLYVDGEKYIETNLKNGYYTLAAEKGKQYKIVIDYMQFSDNAEVKFDMGIMEKATAQTIAERVKDADVIIFVGGISAKLEGEAMPVSIEGFKGGDRTDIALPAIQTNLLKALKATGKPVVFVNMSGSAMGFEWEKANIPAIVQAWYGGQAGGQAVADILFGDYNPAGRLPITFYKNVSDLPDFEDYSMENRTYRYFKGDVLYPFGFGLSYTTFQYGNLKIMENKGEVIVTATVTNIGQKDGDEVVQLYVSHKNTTEKTAIRALKGFKRIHLNSGESRNISFILDKKNISIVASDGKSIIPNGLLEIAVGGGQPTNESLQTKSTVKGNIEIKIFK